MEGDDRSTQNGFEAGTTRETYLKGVIDQGVQALLDELQRGHSEHLLEYLAFSARFHRYSLHNQLLIYLQCPQASRVAGYRQWQKLGYQVAKGQKAIRILAPHSYVRRDEEADEERRGIYFVSVPVFDASQLANLEDKPLPAFWTPLADDQQVLYARLEDAVRDDGIALTESEYLGTVQGFSAHGEIVLKEGLDSRSKVFVLLHEYAHELLHWKDDSRTWTKQRQECHAEAISYVVAARFGLHNPHSSDYLQTWGTTPTELLKELEIVRQTAAHIIDTLQPYTDTIEGGD